MGFIPPFQVTAVKRTIKQTAVSQALNILIKGLGAAGRARLQAIETNPHWQLAGIASRRKTIATRHWQEALQDPQIQAVAISTENTDHARSIKAALEAGKHVLCDYPIALKQSDAQALFKLAQAKEKVLHIEHIALLSEGHLNLKTQAQKAGALIKGKYLFTGGFNKKIANKKLQGPLPILSFSRLMQVADLWGNFSIEKANDQQSATGFCLHLHLKFKEGGLLDFAEKRQAGVLRKRSLIATGKTAEIHWQSGTSRGGLFAKDLEHFYQRITQGQSAYYQENLLLNILQELEKVKLI